MSLGVVLAVYSSLR
jgi:hypothetical protein